MNRAARRWPALLLAAVALAGPPAAPAAEPRLRVIIETDVGGDPDDEQSLVRFLLYSNEWDIEGLIANRPTARPSENRNRERTGLGIVRQHLAAYGEVFPRLREHAPGFPSREQLWARTVPGYAATDEAVALILAAVDRDDPRPVWFQNWGTDHGSDPSNLKRALDRVLAERGPDGYARFKNKILLSSDDQFGDHTGKIEPHWRFWLQHTRPRLEGAYFYHRFGPLTATAGGFDLQRDVLTGHGPLGALYPTNTNIRQKEGDSPYFIHLIPTGMNEPLEPGWGSWAGRFGPRDEPRQSPPGWFWANRRDAWQGSINRDNTLLRWAADLQNDFRARLDWCVKPFAEANHPPTAILNGDRSKQILRVSARPGTAVPLDASPSSDPDGHALSFDWQVYPEAGTYPRPVTIAEPQRPKVQLRIPDDAAGQTLHVILTVRDSGDPPLAAYRRVILRAEPPP